MFFLKYPEGTGSDFIPGFVTLTHRHSRGFAFGLLKSAPEQFHELFMLGIPAFALVLIVLIFIKLRDDQMTTSVALTAIFSGAIGNLIDRLQFGYVIDFIDLKMGPFFTLPALNLADAAIICGVVIMLVSTLKNDLNRTTHA